MSDQAAAPVKFNADGLVPAVVQDADTGEVLMLAFMNDEALRLTYATGQAHYWSRSRRKLWRKGETSGHTQTVEEVRINCERNSLLLLVHQTGAVCHDGYPTCYYRRLSSDGALTTVREQAFLPASVYGNQAPGPAPALTRLADTTREQWGAYAFLSDNDLTAASATSSRLREPGGDFSARIGEELRELAGVLDGSHRHLDALSDLRLEASQVLYWVIVEALRRGFTWTQLRPDTALGGDDVSAPPAVISRILRAEAERWTGQRDPGDAFAAEAHAALALVATACRCGGLDPLDVVASDLQELRSRPYLAAYFGHEEFADDRGVERARTGAG